MWHACGGGFSLSAVRCSNRRCCLFLTGPPSAGVGDRSRSCSNDFTLAATLHTVHGTFALKSGQIHWDPATGRVSGAVVIDATSGNTGNTSRDKNMHTDILESAKFPEITFAPTQIKGAIPKEGPAQIEVSGVIRLHGQDHDVTLTFSVHPDAGGALQASTQLAVPYVKWGLKNPSTFLLHLSDTVNVDIHATVRIAPAAAH